eukprot:1186421-Prorocentrum_minimum.AAC.1
MPDATTEPPAALRPPPLPAPPPPALPAPPSSTLGRFPLWYRPPLPFLSRPVRGGQAAIYYRGNHTFGRL